MMKRVIFFIIFCAFQLCAKKADLVVFSYNRPLQLYALLESVEKYVSGLGSVQVIYRADNKRFGSAYQKVNADFPSVIFVSQGTLPLQDFKPLTLSSVFESEEEYVLFAVDDNLVKDFIDLECVICDMELCKAYAFFLKMGLNLTCCYTMNAQQPLPPYKKIGTSLFLWQFCQGGYDWNYPHTVDMVVYKKSLIEGSLRKMEYHNPNSFESQWAKVAWSSADIMQQWGVCYETTKIINIPLNRAQHEFKNRHMNAWTCEELLELFEHGLKIDIRDIHQMNNASVHIEYIPQFMNR